MLEILIHEVRLKKVMDSYEGLVEFGLRDLYFLYTLNFKKIPRGAESDAAYVPERDSDSSVLNSYNGLVKSQPRAL